jgi:hypothetical protein
VKAIKRKWLWLVGLGLLGIAGVTVMFLVQPATRTCQPRTDDPEGYLLKICQYIQERDLDVSPADPTNYHIKRIEERAEKGRAVLWVFLDCCYLGDIAVIDKASGEVIEFRVGAK